ncbi:MAG: hypothetical protein ACREQE_03470 [Candidatus Binataceae bacterium]
MADHTEHKDARAKATTHGAGHDRDRGEAGLTRGERSLLRRFSEALKFADFMAVAMVLATAFSAFATWRTASVTNLLFSVSERPYVGLRRVSFDSVNDKDARVAIDLRNFGQIAASDGVVIVRLLIDGKPMMHGPATTVNVGMLSPTVPQMIFRLVPASAYRAIADGGVRFVVHVVVSYRGPDKREFCYNELMTYDWRAQAFSSSGGSDRCGGAVY